MVFAKPKPDTVCLHPDFLSNRESIDILGEYILVVLQIGRLRTSLHPLLYYKDHVTKGMGSKIDCSRL